MGILKDHIPLITFLRPGLIKIINEVQKNFFVEEGTVEFTDNNLLILTSTAQELDKINKNSLNTIFSHPAHGDSSGVRGAAILSR